MSKESHNPQAVQQLIQTLETTGLANRPGRLLYSGVGTLVPGRIYMLGYNPGGDPATESDSPKARLEKLAQQNVDWNEYVDGRWMPGGRICAPGDAPMQRRVQHLLAGIGVPVRSVAASNVIFVRSRNASSLEAPAHLAEQCWVVHAFMLKIVQPKVILSIGGNAVFDFVREKGRILSPMKQFPSGHGTWQCQSARIDLGGMPVTLVSVPHLSRYAVNQHPDVLQWVRSHLPA
jgi:hypothetical protein